MFKQKISAEILVLRRENGTMGLNFFAGMIISTAVVAKMAGLAKLDLSDDELKKMTDELEGVLGYAQMLNELPEDTPVTSQVTGLSNVVRPDSVELCEIEDDLLHCSPQSVSEHCVVVPKIM